MRKGIVTFWAAMALCAAPSYAVVDYSIEPLKIYPAEGQTVSSLDRVQIRLDRGFGPVGYDHGAEGMKVYIENEAGERVMLVNAVNAAPAIAPEWGLAEMDGSTHKDVYTYSGRKNIPPRHRWKSRVSPQAKVPIHCRGCSRKATCTTCARKLSPLVRK